MKKVWVLLGHYKGASSDLLGVYRTYRAARKALDTTAFGDYQKVEIIFMDVLG